MDIINVSGLEKEFRLGLRRRRVRAVAGIDFRVPERSIFGFLGPNGAGKTTTIKMLTGLIGPTRGEARVFGQPVPTVASRARLGFLPENPYVFPYLTPLEFVEMSGKLAGLRGSVLRDRARRSLEQTGVWYAADRPVRRLSKGMLQRTGLAAALVSDPELLILDEPMSGLDPVGRKEVKDLILDQKRQGRTVFFSTHILGDVESLCDEVTIMRLGKIVVRGRLDELLRRDKELVSVTVRGESPVLEQYCRERGLVFSVVAGRSQIELEGAPLRKELVERIVSLGLELEEVISHHQTLEEIFVREAIVPDTSKFASSSSADESGRDHPKSVSPL